MRVKALIVILSLLLFGSHAEAQIGAAMTIGQVLQQIEDSANNVIGKAGVEVRSAEMQAAQSALTLVESLRVIYKDSLDKTFDQLNKTERKTFEDARSLVSQADDAAGKNLATLSSISLQISTMVDGLPFAPKQPIVLTVGPLFTVQDGADHALKVQGRNLAEGEPRLSCYGRNLAPAGKTDTELTFMVPARPMPQAQLPADQLVAFLAQHLSSAGTQTALPSTIQYQKPRPETCELTVFHKQRKWLVSSEIHPVHYRVLFFSIPKVIGTYAVYALHNVDVTQRATRQSPGYRCDSGHCHGRQEKPFQVAATPGWQIQTSTIHFNPTHDDHGSLSMEASSTAAFTGRLSCDPYNEAKFLGACVAGNSGVLQGFFTYDETSTQPEARQTLVASGSLDWNQDIPILQLPAGVTSVAVVLVDLTGHLTALIGSGTTRFFSVDQTGQAMVVHARSPQQALTGA